MPDLGWVRYLAEAGDSVAYLNPTEAFQDFQTQVLEGVRQHFPIKGRVLSLHLNDLEVDDALHSDDLRAQHQAKLNGKTWAVPVYATMSLRDNETGKEVDKKRIRLLELPKPTSRYSYIVDGQEYQVDNQWQLKPGVYARRQQNGELQAKFNVTGRSSFDIILDPASKQFTVKYKKANLPLYPLMKTLGVSDDDLERSWGKEIFNANKGARRVAGAVEQFYKTTTGQVAPSKQVAEDFLAKTFQESKLTPEVTQSTLGKPFAHVTGETLHLATQKLLKVQAGAPEDDRDSLVYKNLRTVGDYGRDALARVGRAINQKVQRQLNSVRAESVRDVVKFDLFNEPIRQFFTAAAVSRTPSQINPLEMISSAMQTTIMGPGGIKSDRSVTDEAKMINPSHVGFLDPINTPEGEKTGVTLRLPVGVKKVNNEARIPLYNLKTHTVEDVSPTMFSKSKVVFPDQIEWKDGKPHAKGPVKMVIDGGTIREGKLGDADYAIRHASQLFNITSNLVPFLGNNSGGRAGMASRHMEQAISLVSREAPLVQVSSGASTPSIDTFEKLLGHQTSHRSPVAGTVKKIAKDAIIVTDAAGKDHEVQTYHYYPLNDVKSVLHSSPIVQAGDSVKAGQVLADTNFSRNGALALGTNLRVAYVPFKGYNFEDGVVISQSAADKLSSVHLHKHAIDKLDNVVLDRKLFNASHPGVFKADQLDKLDDQGVVRVGQRVRPGDPLIAAMRPFQIKDRSGLAAIRKHVMGHHSDNSVRWDSDFEGEVVGVHRGDGKLSVHVRTVEPMQVGDKIAGRYGNKGIVTMILPDHEMPHDKAKKPVDVLLNPSGVPGRMNIGQVLETAAAKIATKTGKPYVVKNFDVNTPDYLEKVKGELKQHGLSDTEELFDPVTKKPLGAALTGPQYMLKLVHQVEKKLSVRSGMHLPGVQDQENYDLNLQPSSGGHGGGQSLGALGTYSMLAHGARANLREMQTWKSEGADPQTNESKRWPSQHIDVWKAIQQGTHLPPPQTTFAFQKFTDMLRGAGINVEKKGNELILSPLTDKQILSMSSGELTAAGKMVRARVDKNGEFKPLPGGLFDEKATGGHGGTKWSHIRLAEPVPNPIFEKAIKSLTGLTQKEFDNVVSGASGVHPLTNKIVDAKSGVTGGAGIKAMLQAVDVPKALASAKKELQSAPAAKVDKLFKKVKYLDALNRLGLKADEAYILHNLPVLPPVIRPLTVMQDGNVKYEDVNGLYSQFAQVNDKLKDPVLQQNLTDKKKQGIREEYYDGIKALSGIGSLNRERKERGLLDQISGEQPKNGFFQKTLIQRRQDLTMRSTIVPEPALGLDEVGVPREAALTLFRPFIVRQLVVQGTAPNALAAQKVLAATHKGDENPMVYHALEQVMKERPVLLKRDPALHKYSVQAFKPRIVHGNAVQIHPLVTGGFNADFDGDTMALFVPISHDAVREAEKMFPSNNIFNEASGKVMYQPTLESALGLYKLSTVGAATKHLFSSPAEVADALQRGIVQTSDVVSLQGKKTTPGRVLLASVLPSAMQSKVLHNFDYKIDKKGLDSMFTELGKDHRHDFGRIVNEVKDLGNGASYGIIKTDLTKDHWIPIGTHSLSLEDMSTDKVTRTRALKAAQGKVDDIHKLNISDSEKDRRSIEAWVKASDEMRKEHTELAKQNPSNLFLMQAAGVKPSWDQYKQMVLAPMVLKDSSDRFIPTPVTKSYAEGLDLAGYWTQLHGARRGAVMKVQEVREPGAISKLLMNTSMNMLVEGHDCGTQHGIALPISENDVHDRYLAQDFKTGDLHIPRNTLLTPDLVGRIRALDKNALVVVRSPLKCQMPKGLCQMDIGPSVSGQHHELGTNIGVIAAQSVGERAVQLTLKSFHTGGVQEAGGGSKILNQFARFEQLTKLPQKIPNSATLAMTSGKIEKIEKDPTGVKIWIGNHAHHVGRDVGGMPLHEDLPHVDRSAKVYTAWQPPEVGAYVKAGQVLSDPNRTYVNPRHLYQATGSIEQVQNHLANSIYDLYRDEGLRRRTVETLVKSMSNLTKIEDPGDHEYLIRGEFYPTSMVHHINKTELKDKRPIIHQPVLQGVDMLPLSLQEDWMAKLQHQRLHQTLAEAASTAGASHVHGSHPIPGLAFGSEFGLAKAKPGSGRTPTVSSHHY